MYGPDGLAPALDAEDGGDGVPGPLLAVMKVGNRLRRVFGG